MLYIRAMTSTIFVYIVVVMCMINELKQPNNEYLKKNMNIYFIILFYYW